MIVLYLKPYTEKICCKELNGIEFLPKEKQVIKLVSKRFRFRNLNNLIIKQHL
jgi:hypothetical protein